MKGVMHAHLTVTYAVAKIINGMEYSTIFSKFV
jgi:hypothetical protein